MRSTLQISWKNVPQSPAVEDLIRRKVAWLEKLYPQLVHCRIAVESPDHKHHQGNHYLVRIDLGVPGSELVAGADPAAQHREEDLYAAVQKSFDVARRRLQDFSRKQRGEVKAHSRP